MAEAAENENEVVTAGVLVIGDEILSGRTKDKNIGYIAEYLTVIGIDLKEVRIVPDEEPEIVAALNALRGRYDYVFTTGGIGPTHDDITADAVAKAFGVSIDYDPRAVEILRVRMAQVGGVMNEARMRMARLPAGADLVLDYVTPKLRTGAKMLSQSVRADCREGDIGTELGEIAAGHPGVVIGSYPFMDEQRGANTHVVVRARDAQKLNAAVAAVEAMLTRVKTALAAAPTGR